VLTEIRSLLDTPAAAALASRDAVEDLLTNGYAYALDLEGQRLRIEGRLREVVRSREPTGARARADEVAALERLLAEAERELASVRALLSSLRAQAL
jgi:hypothetical protein